MSLNFLIIGSGLSGSVLGHELVEQLDCHINIREEKPHIPCKCFTSRDEATGIMEYHYRPHRFNTVKKYFRLHEPLARENKFLRTGE